MRHLPLLRGAVLVGCAAAVAACTSSESHEVFGPKVPTGGALFRSYVSLGNSITAGYQSGGINDSTQRAAYPVLLAQAMGSSFVYPSLKSPGCPPPISNLVTGARVGGASSTSTTCALRDPALVSYRVNNVAVPGATSFDPTSASTAASNALTTLILGGETQVQRALQARPTFATVWIGNNDVLAAALSGVLTPTAGVSPGATPLAAFTANYGKMMDSLTAGAPNLKGVLIGVVYVSDVPALVKGIIVANPQVNAAISQIVGTPVYVDSTCSGSGATSLVDLVQLIPQMKAYKASGGTAGHPPVIYCVKGRFIDPRIGDLFVLDPQEHQQIDALIAGYNTYIQAKADSLGFGYYDPNVRLAQYIQSGAIPQVPDFSNAKAPFGQYISLDGVHPSSAAHQVIANDLVDLINTKFRSGVQRDLQ